MGNPTQPGKKPHHKDHHMACGILLVIIRPSQQPEYAPHDTDAEDQPDMTVQAHRFGSHIALVFPSLAIARQKLRAQGDAFSPRAPGLLYSRARIAPCGPGRSRRRTDEKGVHRRSRQLQPVVGQHKIQSAASAAPPSIPWNWIKPQSTMPGYPNEVFIQCQ